MLTALKVLRKVYKCLFLLRRRPKGWRDFLLSFFSYYVHSGKSWGRPVHITIEPTNSCNLRCPVCETGAGQLKRPKGILSYQNFITIIDKLSVHTNTLLLYFMGEPFLHKEVYEMIAYARAKNIFVTTCTNGEFIEAGRLLDCGLNEISFQVGGLTQETHEVYRVGSTLEKIKENIRTVSAEKKRRNLILPKIILGFIVMKHNEHELSSLEGFGKELGVDEVQVISPCVRTAAQAQEFLPADRRYWFYDEQKLSEGILSPAGLERKCSWVYFSTTILWSGEVVPCCRDAQGEYVMGNIFQEKLSDIWNGSKYCHFRKDVISGKEIPLCRLCSGYGYTDLH